MTLPLTKTGRENLEAILAEFERAGRHYPPLYHEQLIAWSERGEVRLSDAQWQAFIDDGGYRRPELWMADGWATVQAQRWEAPDYWHLGPDCMDWLGPKSSNKFGRNVRLRKTSPERNNWPAPVKRRSYFHYVSITISQQ